MGLLIGWDQFDTPREFHWCIVYVGRVHTVGYSDLKQLDENHIGLDKVSTMLGN